MKTFILLSKYLIFGMIVIGVGMGIGYFEDLLSTKPTTSVLGTNIYTTPSESLQATTTIAIMPTTDPDPIIDCSINPACGGGSRKIRKSECDAKVCCTIDSRCGGPKFTTTNACKSSYCCIFNDGTGKLLSSKSACDNYFTNTNNSNPQTSQNNAGYPDCLVYYPSLHFTQTYHNTSPNDCKRVQDEAAKGGVAIPTSTPTSPFNSGGSALSRAQIDQCKAEVNSEVSSRINGCYVQFQDSAANACARGIQDQGSTQIHNCENNGTHNSISGPTNLVNPTAAPLIYGH